MTEREKYKDMKGREKKRVRERERERKLERRLNVRKTEIGR